MHRVDTLTTGSNGPTAWLPPDPALLSTRMALDPGHSLALTLGLASALNRLMLLLDSCEEDDDEEGSVS